MRISWWAASRLPSTQSTRNPVAASPARAPRGSAPPRRSRHHPHPHPHPHHIRPSQARYGAAIHRPLFFATAKDQAPVPTRMQSIGSVVSFDDGSCPLVPYALKQQPQELMVSTSSARYAGKTGEIPVPTVSPTEAASSKPIVEPDATAIKVLSVPSRSPTKEETAIHAMLALRSASFGG